MLNILGLFVDLLDFAVNWHSEISDAAPFYLGERRAG